MPAFKSLSLAVGRVCLGLRAPLPASGVGCVATRYGREDLDATLTLLDLASE
jgi:hypothetical protein